jgi:hypothetical protein
MPMKPCLERGCPRAATAKGRCDLHRRAYERERSARRRGGYTRGPFKDLTEARDADPDHTPTKRWGGGCR